MDVVNPMVRRMQQEARIDPDGFWAKEAERLPWFRKWDAREAWAEMIKEVEANRPS